jgi:hypothetical protein
MSEAAARIDLSGWSAGQMFERLNNIYRDALRVEARL